MACHQGPLSFLLILLVLMPMKSQSFWGFWSSKDQSHSSSGNSRGPNGVRAEFSIEAFNNPKAAELVKVANDKLMGQDSCWKNAYRSLFASCSEVFASEEKRSRLAWLLTDCFQKDSGRSPFPSCDANSLMIDCTKKLDDLEFKLYLEFFLETNTICHQLQAHVFKQDTERVVNELKKAAELAEDKLDIIKGRSDSIFQQSNEIYDSLLSVDLRTQQLAQASMDVKGRIEVILNHSQAVYEQSRGIAAAQSVLQEGQYQMKEQLEEGMAKVHDSYNKLGREIDKLRNEAVEIDKEIVKIRDGMFTKMENLHHKANDIGNMAGISLEKQKQLLDGQSSALEGLDFLTQFQSEALEESRITLQRLAEYSQKQQQDFLQNQERLQHIHDNLEENSKYILDAQEAFESKQATMFAALDKLFALHNAMLLESRVLKAFLVYALLIFILYMFTSTKQTYRVRPWLYIGLCVTFFIEILILRVTTFSVEGQTWIVSFLRLTFGFLAAAQLLYSILKYKDYDVLNHQILLTLIEKINCIEKENSLLSDEDSDMDWSSWIDTELREELNSSEDPDYVPPKEAEGSLITATPCRRKYNLRQ